MVTQSAVLWNLTERLLSRLSCWLLTALPNPVIPLSPVRLPSSLFSFARSLPSSRARAKFKPVVSTTRYSSHEPQQGTTLRNGALYTHSTTPPPPPYITSCRLVPPHLIRPNRQSTKPTATSHKIPTTHASNHIYGIQVRSRNEFEGNSNEFVGNTSE